MLSKMLTLESLGAAPQVIFTLLLIFFCIASVAYKKPAGTCQIYIHEKYAMVLFDSDLKLKQH